MRRLSVVALVLGVFGGMLAGGVALADGIGPSGSFFDDDGNIHEGAIQAIRYEGITAGCNPPHNTNYCPDSDVTRGAMAAFLVRALDLPGTSEDFFGDDDASVFEHDINRLAAAGITRGCNPPTNDRYCPDAKVTRGQMAAFLVRAFGYTDAGDGDLFVDDDESVFEADIDRLGTAGVTKGCNPPTNDRYCPTNRVRRDEMASFLARALKLPLAPPDLDQSTQIGLELDLLAEAQAAGCSAAYTGASDGRLDECTINTSVSDHWDFWVQHGWGSENWSYLTPQERTDEVEALNRLTFRLYLNGTELKTYETFALLEAEDTLFHSFNFQFPYWLSGTHTIVGEWVDDGFVDLRVKAAVDLGD